MQDVSYEAVFIKVPDRCKRSHSAASSSDQQQSIVELSSHNHIPMEGPKNFYLGT